MDLTVALTEHVSPDALTPILLHDACFGQGLARTKADQQRMTQEILIQRHEAHNWQRERYVTVALDESGARDDIADLAMVEPTNPCHHPNLVHGCYTGPWKVVGVILDRLSFPARSRNMRLLCHRQGPSNPANGEWRGNTLALALKDFPDVQSDSFAQNLLLVRCQLPTFHAPRRAVTRISIHSSIMPTAGRNDQLSRVATAASGAPSLCHGRRNAGSNNNTVCTTVFFRQSTRVSRTAFSFGSDPR